MTNNNMSDKTLCSRLYRAAPLIKIYIDIKTLEKIIENI